MLDLSKVDIQKVRIVLRKFSDNSKTDLKEVIVTEDGVLIETWKKGDSRPPPED